jgi:nicotinic acid mononucleotide adenylyltransferase
MWYIFPSDLPTKKPCATFFRIGPFATNDKIGKDTITISQYLKDEKLMKNYMTITEALFDKVEDKMDDDANDDETPQNILREIMNSDVDYLKLKKSIQNFYKPLKARINTVYSTQGTKFIKKMNILNFILNNFSDSEYRIEDDERVQINDGYFEFLDEESQKTDSPESVETVTSTKTSGEETGETSVETGEKDKEEGVKEGDEDKEGAVDAIEGSKKDQEIESVLKLETTNKCRVLTMEQILILMIKNIKDNVFIISGGSYNPPHNGHIKMFESAYNTRKSESDSGIKGYYGIMVVATRQHIITKTSVDTEILYSDDRIKLCKLACDTYSWENPDFNASNMLILNVSDDNPVKTILYRIKALIDINKSLSEDEKKKIKINNLLYLCGSDFFIKWYSASSRYSVICIVRKSEEDTIKKKMEKVNLYDNPYLKEKIDINDSDEYDLSSSVVRDNIYQLQTVRRKNIVNIQDEIIKSIGLPVYCYLADLNYLVDKKYYGKKCEPDSTIDDELRSLSEISVSRDDTGGDDDPDEEDIAKGYYLDYSSTGNIDDIPEKNRNIYIGINTNIVFDSRTIENATHFDNILNQLVSCGIHDKNPRVDFKKMKVYLKSIYDERLYYILNDLCYFKDYKIGNQHCFIQDLLSNGSGNVNLLENMRLLTTREFNDEYLAETEDAQKKIASLISSKDEYLKTIDKGGYQDYSGKTIDKKMVDDIMGFLYESERYSLYLYLIDEEKPQPVEGKKIIVGLYSVVVNQKNDKVEHIFDKLTDSLTSTQMRRKDKSGEKESKLMESLKKGAIGATIAAAAATTTTTTGDVIPVGPKQLLEAVKYVNQRSNCDGNCFYNSIGMLSSKYMVMNELYLQYVKMTLKQKYDVQFAEQTRVRGELTAFLTDIYKLIEGKVDVTTREYKNSPILKYIIKNGKKDFKYVRKISKSVGYKYYGSDEEIYFASLLYSQPIVTVIGVSDNTVFNIFDWNTYSIKDENDVDVLFTDYIKRSEDEIGEDEKQRVISFLLEENRQYSYFTADTSNFLLNHPSSYFLVGGRGHWTYAVNEGLLTDDGVGAVAPPSSGGNASYNVRTTKKIKNKYYKKESSSSSSKTTKKHKKTRRMNKNKKRIKKTIKL